MDRILLAIAREFGATPVTRDREMLAYGEQGNVSVLACYGICNPDIASLIWATLAYVLRRGRRLSHSCLAIEAGITKANVGCMLLFDSSCLGRDIFRVFGQRRLREDNDLSYSICNCSPTLRREDRIPGISYMLSDLV